MGATGAAVSKPDRAAKVATDKQRAALEAFHQWFITCPTEDMKYEVEIAWAAWEASAARYEPLVEAARVLLREAVDACEWDHPSIPCDDAVCLAVEKFRAALAALGDGK